MEPSCGKVLAGGKEGPWWLGRVEIDTSAPFASVKAAVDHFGGSVRWRSSYNRSAAPESPREEISVASVVDETAQLQKVLVVKERETLEVLKELEVAKKAVDSLKFQLRKEESSEKIVPSPRPLYRTKVHPITDLERNEPSKATLDSTIRKDCASPGLLILTELQQAKLNLNRSTSDLEGIRSSIESIKHELEVEKMSLEKVCQHISLKSSLISNLEKELSHTRFILQLAKDAETITAKNPPAISRKLHELRSESERYKRITEGAKFEASKLISDIEHTRVGIKTCEIRLLATKKMEAAARATESSVKAEIKALLNSGKSSSVSPNHTVGVTLSMEEYNALVQRAKDAEKLSNKRIEAAAAQVEEAARSKMELFQRVEEAKVDIRTSKKALSEALSRVEVANKAKLGVEEALRKWRSDNNKRRRSLHSSPRFKNPFPGHHRRDSKTQDMNALGLHASFAQNPNKNSALTPTLSIGQILSRKLVGPEDCKIVTRGRDSVGGRPKVSLGQMLSKHSSSETSMDGIPPQVQFQRKKRLGLVSIALILAKNKENKKKKRRKKREAWSPR